MKLDDLEFELDKMSFDKGDILLATLKAGKHSPPVQAQMLRTLNDNLRNFEQLHDVEILVMTDAVSFNVLSMQPNDRLVITIDCPDMMFENYKVDLEFSDFYQNLKAEGFDIMITNKNLVEKIDNIN